MAKLGRTLFLQVVKGIYMVIRLWVFRQSAQDAHENMLRLLAKFDDSSIAQGLLKRVYAISFPYQPIQVGGVWLDHPFILAAGFVKGMGFETENDALNAVKAGKNIIQGWRSMPALVGAVEFGSYTRYPRIGNTGTVIWRDEKTQSTQNRVGLKNTGAIAGATFLSKQRHLLPNIFGINIAVSPSVTDSAQEKHEVLESIEAFIRREVHPSWFTLNLSCPNTDDDPQSHQTEAKARELCGAVVSYLADYGIPLWVKISPELADTQYIALIRAFEEVGVQAVVATNTMPRIAPSDPKLKAGVGGTRLHPQAVEVVRILANEKQQHGYSIDVIGCGGVQDPMSVKAYQAHGVQVMQYWSSMVFRSPLVAALLLNEMTE